MASAQPVVWTEEQIRGFRLISLLDKTADVLRDEFHRHFPTDPAELYKKIKTHDKKLKSLLKQRVIHRSQYAILLPTMGKTDSLEFDISLLIFALITICPIPAPVTGWETLPLPSDQSKGANIIRLRIDRNKVLHRYFKYDIPTFTNIWDRIVSALDGFGCAKQELLDLKSASLDLSLYADYEKRLQKALKLVVDLEDSREGFTYNLLSCTSSFVGRVRELTEIHRNLTISDETHRAMAIYGLGGVGKSELARQYCDRFSVSYYKQNVIWINGEDTNTMTEDFYNIAERIPLNTSDENGKTLSIKTIVNKVYRFFADRPVLFVFDNVLNKTEMEEFMETNVSTNVSILITSQIAEWSERFHQLRADVLSQEDAFMLITQNLNKKNIVHEIHTKLLCEKLQYLPLALQQSIAYINRWSITTKRYLQLFQSCADRILKISHGDEAYNRTVMTTWNMALHKLKSEENSTLAITLINFMSYLDGKNIKKELFYELYEDEHSVNEALQLLQKYSLIVLCNSEDDLDQTMQMHSLLQYVITKESNQEFFQQFLDMIFLPLDKSSAIEHKSFGKYWFNQLAYMSHKNIYHNIIAAKVFNYLSQLLIIFNSKGKYTMLYGILILLEKDGHQNETTDIQDALAECLRNMGKYDEALIKYREVKKLQIEVLGYNHPHTLTTKHNIARCLSDKGNYDESLSRYQEVEKLQIETIGNKHPSTLTTKHNIALCLSYKGSYDEALSRYQEVEELKIEALGYNHPSTLTTKHNIAECFSDKGSYDEALIRYREVEKLQNEALGYNHPSTLTTKHNIAICLHNKGNYDEALIRYREVEKLDIEALGYNHSSTLATKHNIAQCLSDMGNYDEALIRYQEVEQLDIAALGYNYPNTLTTKHNIAQCLSDKGNYHGALIRFQEVEKLQIEALGYNHPSTLTTKHNIAECFSDKGSYDEALIRYREVEKLEIEALGYNHPSTLKTKHSLAQCLSDKGNYDEALITFQEVEKLQIEALGYNHPSTLTTKHNFAQCLSDKGNYDEALIINREIENLRIQALGYNHPSTLTTKHNIAQCLSDKGNYDEASIIFQEVEKLQIEALGYNHPSTLTTKNNIADCLRKKGNYDEALIIFQEVEKLQIEALGYNHPSTSTTKHNIAQCLSDKGSYDEALIRYREVEKLKIEALGYNHPSTLLTKHNIAQCLGYKGDYDEALSRYQEVENLQVEIIGYNHPSTLTTKNNIVQCLSDKKKYETKLIQSRCCLL